MKVINTTPPPVQPDTEYTLIISARERAALLIVLGQRHKFEDHNDDIINTYDMYKALSNVTTGA